MHSFRGAQLLLSLFCGRERAEEIVGDLLEQRGSSPRAVWLGVLGVLFALNWRFFAAIGVWVLLLIPTGWPFGFYLKSAVARHANPTEIVWAGRCMLAGLCVMSVVVLNAFQSGVRDRTTQLGSALSAEVLMLGGLAESPHRIFVACVLGVVSLALLLSLRTWRRAFLRVSASSLTYAGVFYLLLWPLTPWKDPSPFLVLGWVFGTWLLSFAVESWVLARTRHWALDIAV